jgi:hypothetical protein
VEPLEERCVPTMIVVPPTTDLKRERRGRGGGLLGTFLG